MDETVWALVAAFALAATKRINARKNRAAIGRTVLEDAINANPVGAVD
jgi:hypothetical protein